MSYLSRAIMLALALQLARTLLGRVPVARRRDPQAPSSEVLVAELASRNTRSDEIPRPPAYGYDARRGASAYAPIIGGIAGFVVTAVVLIFTVASARHPLSPDEANLLGRAMGLLVLGLLSCLLGAFVFAAIGAERMLTPNLPPAVLYAGAATAIGVVGVVAAFQVLAALYLPGAKPLFAMITVGMAISGGVLITLVLGDAWVATPLRSELATRYWLSNESDALRWTRVYSLSVVAAISIAAALYFTGGARLHLDSGGVEVLIGIGITLSIAGGLGGMLRTMHPIDQRHRAIEPLETAAVLGCLSAYLSAVVLSMA